MKKWIGLLMAIAVILSMAACGSTKIINLTALGNEIKSANLFADELVRLSDDKLGRYVMLDRKLIATESDGTLKCSYFTGSGVTGEEYGIFECNSAADAKALVAQLENRQTGQQTLYASYAPAAAARISHGFIRSLDVYVFYIVADKYDQAATIADRYF